MAMTVSISEEARSCWRDYAASVGVSVTALVEAIGLALPRFIDQPTAILTATVAEARALDAERRSRQRGPYG